jgi:hypothetical protein
VPRRKRQPPRKASPRGPVGVRAPGPVGVFADPVPRAPSIARPAPKPKVQTPAQRRQSEVKDTKGAADVARGKPASDRAIAGARRRQSEVRDTKGATERLSEPERQKVVAGALTKLAEHVTHHSREYRNTPLARNLHAVGLVDLLKGYPARSSALQAASAGAASAGVLKALEFTARPVHGIAGAADAAVQGKGAAAAHHALTRGLQGKEKKLFSDVIEHTPLKGLPGPAKAALAFGGDVVLDPTTYFTGGAGSVARKAAEDAARQAGTKALRSGFGESAGETAAREAERAAARAGRSADEARKIGEREGARVQKAAVDQVKARAARRAEAAAPKGSGVTVKFAGREVPGVRRGTAAAGRGVKAAGRTVAAAPGARRLAPKVQRTGAGAKELVREVRPQMKPAGVDQAMHEGGRRASRQARAATNHADQENQAFARALQKAVGPDNYEKLIRAIETRTVSKLKDSSPELHTAAVALRSRFRHAKRLRSHAGLGEGTIRDYFPHAREDALESGLGITDQSLVGAAPNGRGGRTVARPTSGKTRSDRRGLHEINPERVAAGDVPFSTNVPLVALNYFDETAKVAAKSDFLKSLAKVGRPVKRGEDLQLKDGEAVYRLGFEPGAKTSTKLKDAKRGEVVLRSPSGRGAFGLREVDDAEIQHVLGHTPGDKNPPQGQYVVLDSRVVEDALSSAQPARAQHTSGRIFDKATGTWKRVATATLGFHVRNGIGDTQMAYLGQPGHVLPRNAGQAVKAVRRVSQTEREAKKVTATPSKSKKTIKVGGQRRPLDDFLAGAKKNGVIRSGYVGRELEDLVHGGGGGASRVRRGTGDRVKRWMQNREDVMRVATYKHGLDRGLSEAQAADLASSIHIDYGDLSETERRYLRRFFPFYTFTGRALPLHVQKLLTNPGKFANIEKAREEVAKATGFDPAETPEVMAEFVQRQAPFVIKIGSGATAFSAQLPLTLLNEIPTSTDAGAYLDEVAKFTAGLLNPALKMPAELYSNTSFFFRRPIEDPNRPLVAAPGWVKHVPKGLWPGLGITDQYVDKRTGKKTWGWRGKADYIVKSAPGPLNAANQLASPGTNRRGQGTVGKSVAVLTGVRADPLDGEAAKTAQLTPLYKQMATLNRRSGMLNQQGVNAKTPTPEYFQLRMQIKQLDTEIKRLSAGDEAPSGPTLDPRALARARRLAARSSGSSEQQARALARARRAASR